MSVFTNPDWLLPWLVGFALIGFTASVAVVAAGVARLIDKTAGAPGDELKCIKDRCHNV